MIKRLIPLVFLIVLLALMTSCAGGLANGNLIGTVVREGSGETISRPHLIIGRTLSSPTTPAQSIIGDTEGRFEITIPGGNYTVQIGTSPDGLFYTWPEEVYVAENQTTIALFQLPVGF